MAEKSLEQQILDLRAKLTNEGKSEKEITEAVIQLELDYAEKQRVMPGVTTPEGVEPVVIGKTKPEVITIDGVETRKSDIVQYLEDPSLILNAGGTQADVDKWTQLVNTYDGDVNKAYNAYIETLSETHEIGYERLGPEADSIEALGEELDIKGDVVKYHPGTMIPEDEGMIDVGDEITVEPTETYTREDISNQQAGEMMELTYNQAVEELNSKGIDTPEQRLSKLQVDLLGNIKGVMESDGFTTPNNVDWFDKKAYDAYGKKLLTNFFDNDEDIQNIQNGVIERNSDILDAKREELGKELEPYINVGEYVVSYDIGYWDKVNEVENEYSEFVNNLIFEDPAFRNRVDLWNGEYERITGPFLQHAITEQNKEAIRLRDSLFNLNATNQEDRFVGFEEAFDKIFGAEPGSINDLGFGVDARVLKQALIDITGTKWWDDAFDTNFESAQRRGLEMLSVDKGTEAGKFGLVTERQIELASWMMSKEDFEKAQKESGGKWEEAWWYGDALNYKGQDTPVWFNPRTGEIEPVYRNINGEWKKRTGALMGAPTPTEIERDGIVETTFAEAEKLAKAGITTKMQEAAKFYGENIDKEIENGNWEAREFTDFLSNLVNGEFGQALAFIPEVILKQLPYMFTTRMTYGLYTVAMEGGNIAGDRIRENAAEAAGVELQDLTAVQIQEYMDNNSDEVDWIIDTSMAAGFGIAGAEYASAGFIIKQSKYALSGLRELIKGNIRQAGKQFVGGLSPATKAAWVEAGTEGFQTGIEQLARGRFNALEYVQAMGEGFIGGFALTGGGSMAQNAVTSIKDIILSARVNYKDPQFYKKIENSYKIKQSEIEKKFKDGDIDAEQRQEELMDISDERNALLKIPAYYSPETKSKIFDLMQQRDGLINEIENTDPALSKDLEKELDEINEKILDLTVGERLNKNVNRIQSLVDKSNGKVRMRRFKYDRSAKNFIKKQNESGKWDGPGDTSSLGTIFTNKETGEQLIVVNETESRNLKDVAVADHEFLHALLFMTVKNNPEAATAMGKALLNYIDQIDTDGLMTENLRERYEAYKKLPIEVQYEEALTFLADAIINEEITINETFGDKISNLIRSLLGKLGINIRFKTGKDVFNFVKDYARRNLEGKDLNRSMMNLLDKGIIIGTDLGTETEQSTIGAIIEGQAGDQVSGKKSMRVKPGDLTELTKEYQQELKTNPKANPNKDLKSQYTAASLAALKRWGAKRGVSFTLYEGGQLSKQGREALSAINNQFADIMRTYKPIVNGKKIELTTYLDQTIGPRVGVPLVEEATRTQKQVSTDKLQEKGFSPQTTTQKDFDETKDSDRGRKKKYPSSIPSVRRQITEGLANEIIGGVDPEGRVSGLAKEIISLVGRNINPEVIAREIIGVTKNKEYMRMLRGAIGKFGSPEYNAFVDRVIDEGLISTIPSATIKRRLGFQRNVAAGLIKYKKIGKTKQIKVDQKGKKTYSTPDVYSITKLDKEKLKKYYKAGEKRQQSLFSMLTEGTMAEGLQTLKNDKAFMDRLRTVLEVKNSPLTAEEFMSGLEERLDQRTKEDTSLDKVEIAKSSKRKAPVYNKESLNKPTRDLLDISNARDFHAALKILDPTYSRSSVNESNLDEVHARNINAVKKGKIGTAVIQMSQLTYFGRLFKYGKLDKNGKFIDKNPRTGKNYTSKSPGAKKFFKLKNGTWVQDKTPAADLKGKNRGKFLPKSGKTYYGSTDPAFETLMDEARKNDSLQFNLKLKALKPKRINLPKDKRITKEFLEKNKDQIEINRKALRLYVDNLSKAHNKNGVALADIIPFIAASYQATGGLIKIAAPFKGVSNRFRYGKGSNYNRGVKYREEHNPPASVVGGSIAWAIKYDYVNEMMDAIDKNYYQTQISKLDDERIDSNGYGSVLLEGTTLLDDFVGLARLAASGINLSTIIDPVTRKSLVEQEMGLGLSATQAQNPSLRHYQNELVMAVAKGEISLEKAQEHLKAGIPVNIAKNDRVKWNAKNLAPTILKADMTAEDVMTVSKNSLRTKSIAVGDAPRKGISVFDFDDTIAKTKEKVIVNYPDGTQAEISAAQFAQQAEQLEVDGATFDFSQFENVKGAKKGPLADLALRRQDKFGSKDIFILTARPQNSARAIKTFLDGIGLSIPLENITGLEDGSPQAKADWVLDKAAKGYNDFYFADDSLVNVQAVKNILDQIDVKSDVQVAKSSKRKKLSTDFNKMLEDTTGKEEFKNYSKARAQLEGKLRDRGLWKTARRTMTITPSADDFLGLMYSFAGRGKKGSQHLEWIHENLIYPYNKAEQEIVSAKVAAARDFNALIEKFPSLKRRDKFSFSNPLSEEIGVGPFTKSHGVRVYIWTKQGMEIPGLSKADAARLVKAVEADSELNVFADEILLMNRTEQYPGPQNNWEAGTIATDIERSIDKGLRKELLSEWQANVDIIFDEDNLNKIEALYGSKFREAIEETLGRMKSGSNRPVAQSRPWEMVLNWLNASVGAIMFLNTRSGLLQLTSALNYINWGDNNIIAAGNAMMSKEWIPTVIKLMNSDYLVNRRDGLKINVNEAELADAAKTGGFNGMISYLLNKGFIITRIMDTLAIATGGAAFYINRKKSLQNRINKETGKLYTEAEAETKAFEDFYAISEESQQSSNPSKISGQQASWGGRIILSFQNITMQYNRKSKKAVQNLYNRRKIPGLTQRESDLSHISQILYYTMVQNVIFHSLQQTLFAVLFNDEEDEETKNKVANIANGMVDSLLFGLGYGGAVISTVKNILLELADQHGKETPKYEEAVWNAFDFSPVLDNKVRKLRSGFRTFSWEKEAMKQRGWSLDNPAYLAIGQIIAAGTNIPIDRVLRKTMNLRAAIDEETRTWQRVALLLGWSTWNVGLPYWGLESTITKEENNKKRAKDQYIKDRDRIKAQGFVKSDSKDKPKGELGKDYYALEKWTGVLEYWVKGEKSKKYTLKESKTSDNPAKQTKFDSIRKKKKADQIKTLENFGLSKEEIKALRYEKDRVEKILELMES
tara:strand:+ start:18628 stop:27639 length:9012 start_codon:yes stop_codon:yes gene_type:complete